MAITNLTYDDGTVTVSLNFQGALTTAFVYHFSTGVSARGHALHNVADPYDQTFGSDLAIARAKERDCSGGREVEFVSLRSGLKT